MKSLMKAALCAVLCCFIITGCSKHVGSSREIKVLTYNIYHGEKYYSRGESNLEEIARVINEYEPDFVALQEVDKMTARTARFNDGVRKDLMQELAALTGMYGYFGKAMDYDGGGYGEGILSRYPNEPSIHQLPIPQGGEPRALIGIEHVFQDGGKVVFAGTHLCHEFESNRIAQAGAIAALIAKSEIPMIVAGDFNFTPTGAAYVSMSEAALDAAKVFGEPSNTYSYHNPDQRLDYLFLDGKSRWSVKELKVIQNDASDHLPVFAVLELK